MTKFIRKIGNLLSGTPFYAPAEYLYEKTRRFRWMLLGKYYSITYRDSRDDGFYKIQVDDSRVSDFYLALPDSGPSKYKRMKGQWEPEVLTALVDHSQNDSVFWEVGAAWGYFSNALAPSVRQVIAFEALDERAKMIGESADKNGYNNITAVTGIVGENVELNSYPIPDILLIDVEGFEYEILSDNEFLFDTNAIFVVEIHSEIAYVPEGTNPNVNPEGVLNLFKENNYTTIKIDEGHNYHILAMPN